MMTKAVITVEVGTPIEEAAETLVTHRIGSLGVKKKGKIVGIVTDRDFVEFLSGRKQGKYIEDIMSHPIIKIDGDANLFDAVKLMGEKKVKHLFITDKGKVVGVVSLRDVIASMPEFVLSYISDKLSDFDIKVASKF
jgi:CBS domain-containing protein